MAYGHWYAPQNPLWFDHNWLGEKSDVFEAAYIMASHNLAALKIALDGAKANIPVFSFRYASTDAMDVHSVVIPNAPVVCMSFLERTDADVISTAGRQGNWYWRTARTRIAP